VRFSIIIIIIIIIIYNQLDKGEKIMGVYLDLQKAFDTVNHDILIYKLATYGIRGTTLNWFRNYLTNHKQFTIVNDTKSDVLDITCGVPQGSVLGPLLFLVYVNDIQNSVPEAKLKLFADDSTNTNKLLNNLNKWFVGNKLSLNIQKTCYSAFSSGQAYNDYGLNSLNTR